MDKADHRLLKFALKLIDEAAQDCESLKLDSKADELTNIMESLSSPPKPSE